MIFYNSGLIEIKITKFVEKNHFEPLIGAVKEECCACKCLNATNEINLLSTSVVCEKPVRNSKKHIQQEL